MLQKHASYIFIGLLLLTSPLSAQDRDVFFHAEKKSFYYLSADQEMVLNPARQAMDDYDVIDYRLEILLFPDSKEIKGRVQIKLVPLVSFENGLVLDFAGLQLDSAFIADQPVSYKREGGILTLFSGHTMMAADTQTVVLHYQGQPDRGLYFRQNAGNETVVYSHNEPYDAHYWFPCKDIPADKATASILVTVPGTWRVLSNGRLTGESNAGPGLTLYSWREAYPIATYLISLAAAPYQIATDQFISDAGILPLQYWVYAPDYERGRSALQDTGEMIGFFSDFIGDYPFALEKYAMAEVPLREAAAMENQTATTMGDFVMDDRGIIAHELAHQWWGDALTPQSYIDIWLNEGFATYFDALFREYKYGREAYDNQMEALKTNMNKDGSLAYPVYDPPEQYLFGNAVYNKGAWVLHMLRHETGDALFKKICQTYFETYKYLNVTSADFIRLTEDISGRSFDAFFDQWLNYGGLPTLIARWSQEGDLLTFSIDQYQEEPVYQFNLDVLIEGMTKDTLIQMDIRGKYSSRMVSFAETVIRLTLDPSGKILNNNNTPLFYIPAQAGFLRIYPNPFRERVAIEYQIEKPQEVEIRIYDILGQQVAELVKGKKNTGIYLVQWNGQQAASGIYYCRLKTDGIRETRKIVLIK